MTGSWQQYAYVSGLGPHWLADDCDPYDGMTEVDFESQSEREEREASERDNYTPSHTCAWEEFCIMRMLP